jgi:uncharacterized BrkB/YihY/UPF0761 family membrane protein
VNRGVAVLLAIIGGAALAFAAVLVGVGALAGLLWIYVFGDNPWPGWVDAALNLAIPIIGLALWACFGWFIWRRLTVSPPTG